MKKLTKIISIILVFLLCFTTVACGSDGDKDSSEHSDALTARETNKLIYDKGVHEYNMSDRDDYLVSNGKTEYSLVIPTQSSKKILSARQEFSYFFEIATGINIRVMTDGNIDVTNLESTKYISLGSNRLFEASGLKASKQETGYDGFKITTVNDNIFLYGVTENSAWYAVYAFMDIFFNLEVYTANTFTIDKNCTNVKMKNLDVVDAPDFDSRIVKVTAVNHYKNTIEEDYDTHYYGHRMGLQDYYYENQMFIYSIDENHSLRGRGSTDTIIPRKEKTVEGKTIAGYEGSHPDWFSDNGLQLCYTAHGNQEEYNLLVDELAETITYSLKVYNPKDYPRQNIVPIIIEDNINNCSCKACLETTKKYGGSDCAAIVLLMNKVAVKVEEWMNKEENKEYYRDDFKIMFEAYMWSTMPPTYYDETEQKYKPIDESVVMHPLLMVDFANIDGDYQRSIYHEENQWMRDYAEGWRALTDSFRWYLYGAQNRSFYLFYDDLDNLTTDVFQYYAKLSGDGVSDILYELRGGSGGYADSLWFSLKTYLASKLMWDSTLDHNKLTEDFFNAVYGEGAEYMRQLLDETRIFYHSENDRLGNLGSKKTMYIDIKIKFNWNVNHIKGLIGLGDKALEQVAYLKETNPEEYDRISENIELEIASHEMLLLEYLVDDLSIEEEQFYKNRLTENVIKWRWRGMEMAHIAFGASTYLYQWLGIIL